MMYLTSTCRIDAAFMLRDSGLGMMYLIFKCKVDAAGL